MVRKMWRSESLSQCLLTRFRGLNDTCVICKKSIPNVSTRRQSGNVGHYDVTTDDLYTTECNHTFHIKCLNRWVSSPTGHTCPICRTKLRPSKSELLTLKTCIQIIRQYLEFIDDVGQDWWWDYGPMDEESKFIDDKNYILSNENMFARGSWLYIMSDEAVRVRFHESRPNLMPRSEFVTSLISSMTVLNEAKKVDNRLYW